MYHHHHDHVSYPDNFIDVSLRLYSSGSLDKVTTHATPRFRKLLKQLSVQRERLIGAIYA